MKFIICILIILGSLLLHADERVNPFTSYNRQIEFLSKQVLEVSKDQKAGIQKKLDDVQKQKAKAKKKKKESSPTFVD